MVAMKLCSNEAVGGGSYLRNIVKIFFGVIQSLTRTPNIQIMFIEKLALNLHIDMYVLCLYTEIDEIEDMDIDKKH